jgi:hypothetical protein
MAKEEFILKANLKHDNKYNYDKVIYKDEDTYILIVCDIHGVYNRTPINHLKGYGCYYCKNNNKMTYEEFLFKANLKHNNKYTYYEETFKGSSHKIKINCEKHGDFEQYAKDHIKGASCFKCSNTDIDLLLEELKDTKYDYKYVKEDFKTLKTKVRIICPDHDIFEQTMGWHKKGHGCPKCKYSKGEKSIEEFLINNSINYVTQKKFDDCKNKSCLPFDFYLPDYNMCIEFDGRFHFDEIFNQLELTQINDKIKTEYCLNKNIILYRISYKEDLQESLFAISKTIILQI